MNTHCRSSRTAQSGFSMLELLISMGVMMAVTAGVFTLMNPVTGSFTTQPEVQDVQERLRVGADRIKHNLETAGAGTYAASKGQNIAAAAGVLGTNSAGAGSLKFYIPATFPRRAGLVSPDAPTVVKSDTITIIGGPVTPTQTSIWFNTGMLTVSDPLTVAWSTGCALGDPACGFAGGERAIVYDDNSNWDLFTVNSAVDNGCPNPPCGQFTTANVTHTPAALTFTYFPRAQVAGIEANTYYLNHGTNQLMHNDGFTGTDDVVLDDVVNLKFDYFGEADPPKIIVEPTNNTPVVMFGVSGGSWTTYGPMPPVTGQQGVGCFNGAPGSAPNCQAGASAFFWAAGENCAFTVNPGDGKHYPRLPVLNHATGVSAVDGAAELVPLNDATVNPGIFNDGPWCPSPTSPNRFDADMLRIRKVRVTLRVQSPVAALRGPAGPLFTNGGTGMAPKLVPDQEIRFDVTMRNLSFGR